MYKSVKKFCFIILYNKRQSMSFIKKIKSNKLWVFIITTVTCLLLLTCLISLKHHHQIVVKKQLTLPHLENSATKPKSTPAISLRNGWIDIHPVSGDTLSKIFVRAGIPQSILQNIIHHSKQSKLFSKVLLTQDIRFNFKNNELIEMIFPIDDFQFISIHKVGDNYPSKIDSKPMTERREYVSTPVKGSLYQTAKMANLPIKLIDQMNQIFFWQVKIGKEIKPGDRLNITYQAYYINDKRVKIGDILAVSYRHPNGTSYEAIRHVSRNGEVAYYHPNGSSLKKAFNRYPIRFSHISSSFGASRKHPILHYHRPHKGIDLAAPIGTPIYSIGEGRIAFIGRQNGYGNMIKIVHDRQYTTVYAHMLKFQKGLHKGSSIKKGQIIGFVGQSGLATGPHCHYELHVNRIPRNPTTVALPQAMPIPKHEAFAFNRRARELIAQLKLYEDSQLATARSPGQHVLS
ncbi:MAG: peptidase M24 [Gammaproteobacteria bacterium]|nr:peptidase M24 [Gammaproteobacteria bacterium]